MDIYDSGEYLSGIELQYLVDGDVMKYVLHYRTLRGKPAPKGGNQLQMQKPVLT